MAGTLSKIENPVKLGLPRALVTYSRLVNLISCSGEKLSIWPRRPAGLACRMMLPKHEELAGHEDVLGVDVVADD